MKIFQNPVRERDPDNPPEASHSKDGPLPLDRFMEMALYHPEQGWL